MITSLFSAANEAKREGQYSVAHAIFAVLLEAWVEGKITLSFEYEVEGSPITTQTLKAFPVKGNEYLGLLVLRSGKEYLNIPVPLLNYERVRTYVDQMKITVVPRRPHRSKPEVASDVGSSDIISLLTSLGLSNDAQPGSWLANKAFGIIDGECRQFANSYTAILAGAQIVASEAEEAKATYSRNGATTFWYWRDTSSCNEGDFEQTDSYEDACSDPYRRSPIYGNKPGVEGWIESESNFYVFFNSVTAEGYVELKGPGDGNYAGSGCHPYQCYEGYDEPEEANHRLNELYEEHSPV